jgi:hypothetical protein
MGGLLRYSLRARAGNAAQPGQSQRALCPAVASVVGWLGWISCAGVATPKPKAYKGGRNRETRHLFYCLVEPSAPQVAIMDGHMLGVRPQSQLAGPQPPEAPLGRHSNA